MDDLDYPCRCGHLAGQHAMEKSNIFKMCLMDYISADVKCDCDNFVSDNLKYLEKRVDEKETNAEGSK